MPMSVVERMATVMLVCGLSALIYDSGGGGLPIFERSAGFIGEATGEIIQDTIDTHMGTINTQWQ